MERVGGTDGWDKCCGAAREGEGARAEEKGRGGGRGRAVIIKDTLNKIFPPKVNVACKRFLAKGKRFILCSFFTRKKNYRYARISCIFVFGFCILT